MSAAPAAVKQDDMEIFRGVVKRLSAEFKAALPPQIPVERFIRTTLTAVQMQPALLGADRRTLLGACMRAAQDGLLPDGRESALVIFKSRHGLPTVQYMPMIGGLMKKARNSGEIASISAHVAYEKDAFDYVLGDDEHINHKPHLGADRGKPIAAYAIAKTKDGGVYRDVMSVDDIERVRKVSRAKDDGPWVEWWDEMAKKTVFRRLAKRLPSSADLEHSLDDDNDAVGFVQVPPSGPSLLGPGAAAAPEEERAPETTTTEPRVPERTRALVEEQTATEQHEEGDTAEAARADAARDAGG